MATSNGDMGQRTRASASDAGRMRGGPLTLVALVAGSLSALLLAASAGLWATTVRAADGLERVTVFAGLRERPLQLVNGSVDVLLVATGRSDDSRRLAYAVLAHVSRRHDGTVLVDLPAGSLVDVPAHTAGGKQLEARKRTLATAYAHGGPQLLVRAFEATTKVRLDGYAELHLPDLAALVDEHGGLTVCVPTEVVDKAAELRLAPGTHRLSGAQAVAYLRTTSGGPLERVRRNQVALAAFATRLFGATAVLRRGANRQLVDAGARTLRVDESFDLGLARRLTLALRDPYGDQVAAVSVPAVKTTETAKGTTTTWQNRLAEYLFEKIRTDAELDPELVRPAAVPVAPDKVKVEVRNGTGIRGLARDTAADLASLGFDVQGKPANAESRTGTTTIRYGAKYEKHARTVQAALPGSQLDETKQDGATVVAVVGGNYTGVRQVTHTEPKAEPADETAVAAPCTGKGA